MKHLNRILSAIASLEYHTPADCVELRLYLLSLMQEFASQYRNIKNTQGAVLITKAYRELRSLYKNFTTATAGNGRSYRAQFEFAKTLITDQAERAIPVLNTENIAVA
ncbi:MAG TPA: hypothetical protein VHB48_04410 [Chitinophagaceae bacterium]|jgi:hypothetical protein|nr:hypothetical protein [Chitinophagaceae bacterium]